MASDLENKYNEILGIKAEVKEEVPVEATKQEVAENKEEGVETAESENEKLETKVKEGETPSEDLEEELKNIDPELKEAILKASPELRESQIKVFRKMRASIDRKHTEFGEARKLAETTKDFFKQYGLDEKRGLEQVKNLIELERQLKANPKETIKTLKTLFKVEEDVKSGSEEEIDLDSFTENERILFNQIKKAEEEAKLARQEAEKFKRLSEQDQQDLVLKEINQFKAAVYEDGSLKNPYFDDLLPEMERLSTLYPKDNVEKLYSKAVKLNDEIAAKIEKDRREKEGKFLSKKQEEALLKAKSINSQSLKHKSSSATQARSLDDILADILADAS